MLNRKISWDKNVSKLSPKACILYTWFIAHQDVKGRVNSLATTIKGNIVPHLKYIAVNSIPLLLQEMQSAGLCVLYGENQEYCQMLGFNKNQKIDENRESPSEIPPPPEQLESYSGVTQELLGSNSGLTPPQVKEKFKEKLKLSKDKNVEVCVIDDEQEKKKKAKELHRWQTERFDRIWVRYPRREGRANALKHFIAQIKTDDEWTEIKLALANYKQHIDKNRVEPQFIKMGSTWFNQWHDWIKHPTEKNEYT